MGVFDNAKIVKINNTEVDSIITADGATIYQKPTVITINESSVSFGKSSKKWLNTTGNVVINWGDGSTNTINNPTTSLSHTYTDGKQSHNIVFLGKVTSLGKNCFYNCTGLTSITIPLSVTSLENDCFNGCARLTSITIPSSVTSLQDSCFRNCTGLTSITIPSSVTSLGYNCFSSCTSLTSVVIPNSITALEQQCFWGCTGLTSVTIPSSVTSLGFQCFSSCTSLNTYQLYWTNNNIITYDSSKMPNNTNTKFYVPKGQKTNYVNKGYPSAKVVERSS